MKFILGLAALWLASQILTDLVRHSAFHDLARGWSRILFTMTSLLAIDLIFDDKRRRIALFAIGLSFGLLLGYLFSPDALQQTDPWKFGLGFPVTLLLVVVATQRPVRRIALLPVGILCAAAFLNLALGYRSLGGICFLAAGYIAFQTYSLRKAHGPPRLSLGRIAVVSGLTILLGLGFLRGYEYAAAHGLLGRRRSRSTRSNRRASPALFLSPTGRLSTSVSRQLQLHRSSVMALGLETRNTQPKHLQISKMPDTTWILI